MYGCNEQITLEIVSGEVVAKAGIYGIEIGIEEDVTLVRTIYVTVRDEDTVMNDSYALQAENFTIDIKEVEDLDILYRSNAKAWNIRTGATITPIIRSGVTLRSIVRAGEVAAEAGIYAITIGIEEDATLTKTIFVTVRDEHTVINENYALRAENFTIDIAEVEGLDIINQSNASAWNIHTEEDALPLVIGGSINNTIGIYPIEIGIEEDALITRTIYVTVIDKNTVIGNNYAIRAENFTIDITEVADLNILERSNANAWNIDSREEVSPIIRSGQVNEQAGVYAIEIGIEEEDTLIRTIYVTVTDENTAINDRYAIQAENITINIAEVNGLDIIVKSNALAWDIHTGEAISPIVRSGQVDEQVGVYAITIGIEEDETITRPIFASVIDDNTIVHNGYAISAEDFTINITEVNGLDIIKKSNAIAWNINTGAELAPVVKDGVVNQVVGMYPIDLGIEEDADITKVINVTVENIGTIGDTWNDNKVDGVSYDKGEAIDTGDTLNSQATLTLFGSIILLIAILKKKKDENKAV